VDLIPVSTRESVRSCLAGVVRGEPLQANVCYSARLEKRLHELVALHHFDVVHVEHLRAARIVSTLPGRLPTLFDAVDSIALLLQRTIRSSHSVRQRLIATLELHRTRAFEARILTRYDRSIVTSADDAHALRALAPTAHVEVVPNGVDLDYFHPTSEPVAPATLVFSGKMSYHANVSAVVHFVKNIFPLVRRNRPDVRLRIVGSGPPAPIRELARDPAIEVTGHVADLRTYVSTATVAVCPVTVKVGIQNKLLEAMAMQVPVVATRAGAEGLTATPGRDLLVADSSAEFAAHVCRLIADPALARSIARSGRLYVEQHHRWSDIVCTVESQYVEAIGQRASLGGSGLNQG
jgi:glycosyltransferase involved in cell wall biosynthesis